MDTNDSTVVAAYNQLSDALTNLVPSAIQGLAGDRDGLVLLLAVHRELMKTMKQADTIIESEVLKHEFEFGGEQIEPVGFVRIHRSGKKTRYDNDAVISRLAAAMSDHVALPDPETGAYPPVPVIVENAVNRMADLTGARTMSFNSWRKTAAKDLGIDVSKYAHEEGGTLSVSIE